MGERLLRRFWVFDINKSDVVLNRFRLLLGDQVARRFAYVETDFAKAIKIIENCLISGRSLPDAAAKWDASVRP